MDHPEPLSKHPPSRPIPECRKGFTLEEARQFIDQVMEMFRTLDEMADLKSMFETGKQLSRAYFDCHAYRSELSEHLTACDYPAYACRMMKRLNNMGVFKHDDIWFASFYFYNTTWNFSDISSDFASSLAAAGLPSLLNLNIAHKPYLDNLNSKNVYYLIKASLSIIHNIARVAGNMHYFSSDSVKQALIQLARRDEGDFLGCVSTLCLAHVVSDPDLHLVMEFDTGHSGSSIDLARLLLNLISTARASEKRRCHGFNLVDLLAALAAYSVHDAVKPTLLTANLLPPDTSSSATTCLGLVKDMLESSVSSSSSASSSTTNASSSNAQREIDELVKILWNLTFDPNPSSGQTLGQLKTWLSNLLDKLPSGFSPPVRLALDSAIYRLSSARTPKPALTTASKCGPILVSFAAANRPLVSRLLERLQQAQLPVVEAINSPNVGDACQDSVSGALSAAALKSTNSRQQWLSDCVGQSSVSIVCLSDAYRLSPGCRLELESLSDMQCPIVPTLIQAKFKPSGWLTKFISRPLIDLNGAKRDCEANLDALVEQVKELYSATKRQAEEAAAAAGQKQQQQQQQQRPPVRAVGDPGGLLPSSHHEQMAPQAQAASEPRSTRSSLRRDEYPSPPVAHVPRALSSSVKEGTSSWANAHHHVWRHVVRPEVRQWSTSTVASWLRHRKLAHLTSQFAGGIDGILLSQLAGLRVWAPNYFASSLKTELNLAFVDSLLLLEALDELVPDDVDSDEIGPVPQPIGGDSVPGMTDHTVDDHHLDGPASRV